jgi:hypothetical protein
MSFISGIPDLVADPTLVAGHPRDEPRRPPRRPRRLQRQRADRPVPAPQHPVYFNRDWKEEYGGILDLWDEDVRHCLGRFAPIFNRAAGFATSATPWHGVTPVTCPPNMMRRSFAAYYYTREPPPGWDGIRRSTVFRARPDERWKGQVAMPVESLVQTMRGGVGGTEEETARYAFVLIGALSPAALARVAHGQHLPLMAVGLVPVDAAAAELGVNAVVDRRVHEAAVGDPGRLDPAEDGVELGLRDAKAEVIDREVVPGSRRSRASGRR